MRTLSFGALLFVLWLSLSGHFDPLLLALGVASTALTVFLARRMSILDRESHPVHLAFPLLKFHAFLAREILFANWDVARRILGFGNPISPHMVKLALPQRSELWQVIYANSITLTPGTVSVKLNTNEILVHALSEEGAEDLRTGRLARAIPEDTGVD